MAALLIIGAISEFAGIVLLGFPDFLPGAIRLSGWLRRHVRRVVNGVRRLFRRQPRGVVHTVSAGGAIAMGGNVRGRASTSATELGDQVAYLLRRDQDNQAMFDHLGERLSKLEAESPRRLAELRRAMEAHVANELRAALEVYRPLRIAGTVALAVGLVCVTAAALLA